MTNTSINQPVSPNHEEIATMIPWYIKGKLTAHEHAQVKDHLSQCADCQQELAVCENLTQSLTANPATSWKPSPAHFASIMAKVDQLEAEAKPLQTSKPVVKKVSFWLKLTQLFTQTPKPVRWTLAAETLAFAALALAIALPTQLQHFNNAGTFETLSNDTKPGTASMQSLHLLFDDTMTTKEISALLLQIKAQIRQGPNAVGVYTIEVAQADAEAAQALLSSQPKVKLVLPVK